MRLADMLRGNALAKADKPLLIDETRTTSFAEMNDLTERVAVGLRARGIEVGDRVALLLPNGVDFVVAFMAVNKAGAVSVPINPKLAAGEVAHLLADSKPTAIFLSSATRGTVEQAAPDGSVMRIAVNGAEGTETDLDDLAASPPDVLRLPSGLDDCMIGYTSGTTGQPKGVLLTDANFIIANGLMNGFMWGLTADERYLVTTPMVHRTGLGRIVNAVCHGSTVYSRQRFDPDETRELIAREQITVLSMVPTVGRLLLEEIERSPESFASVTKIVATGEAFPVDLKRRMMEALPQMEIHSYFAMTEAGLVSSLTPEHQLTHPSSVGMPAPGVEVELWDETGDRVPQGEIGELCVRTGEPGRWLIMKGYYNQPGLTGEVMDDGWFRTGDMARFDEEGFLYIVDRKKDMVLTGGYNVYSKDVEQVIRDMEAIADAAIIGVPDEMYGERVVAIVQLNRDATLTGDEVIEHCRKNLAGYKKPREVHVVAEMPRTSTGKLNKAELREQFRP